MISLIAFACFLTSATAQYGYSEESILLVDSQTGRIRGFRSTDDHDFYLGGLSRVHFDMDGLHCSDAFVGRGLEEAEAMLFAIDSVNNDPSLLPTVRLGYDMRDYCGVENVAIDEIIDWVLASNVVTSSGGCDPESAVNSGGAVLAAVVGAFHSRVSGPVASFLRPFEVPQVSFGSASPVLDSRVRYSYFLRTVPPDTVRSEVVVSIMHSQGWNIISAVHSNEIFGEFGIDAFRELALKEGICLDLDEGIDEDFSEREYAELAGRIYNSSTSVVLVFALEDYIHPLLREIYKIQPPKRFVWIAAGSWGESTSMQEEFGDLLVGMLSVAPFAPITEEFSAQYYKQVTPSSNKRDPYFVEYCKNFTSTIGGTCDNDTSIADIPGFSPGTFASFIIEAVYSVAHGLHNFLVENCASPVEWNRTTASCKGQKMTLNGSVLFDYISRVNFTVPGTNGRLAFNEFGSPEVPEYRIDIFRKSPMGKMCLLMLVCGIP